MVVYADHPFELITTPEVKGLRASKDYVPDMYDRVASSMAVAHCMIIRGLNSVYLQAPHIQPKDEGAFIQYAMRWCWEIEVHHDGEETGFFPAVEELAGEKGVMDANVEQHAAFHDGVSALHKYLQSVADGKETYDGSRITGLIDAFGETLTQHLAEEIPTLQNLRRFGDEKMALLEKRMLELDAKNIKKLGLFTGVCWGFSNHDKTYEDGHWRDWPGAPRLLVLMINHVAWWVHSSWWKFGSCDRWGNLQPLYAVPENQQPRN